MSQAPLSARAGPAPWRGPRSAAPGIAARPGGLLLGGALLGGALLGGALHGDEPPAPPAPPPELLAPVRTDPDGQATAMARDVEHLWEQGTEPERLRALLAALALQRPDVLVPLPDLADGVDAAPGALFVPARDLVERVAWRLAPEERARLAREATPAASALWRARARTGDEAALARLVEPPILDDEGLDALLAAAERQLEHGFAARAAQLFARWRRLARSAPAERRARVAGRHVETLALLGDAHGLLVCPGIDAALSPGDAAGGTTVAELARARRDLLARRASAPRGAVGPHVPARLALLWSRDLADDGLRGDPPPSEVVSEGLWAEPGLLLLHEGRCVRRLDPLTGRERWAFPALPQGWAHHPAVKYAPHDVPLRCVVRAGGLALAVLGDPGASGAFEHQRQDVDVDAGPRESRARLIALDLEDGSLRWHTGAARETHPVLGELAVSCISPPLVVGDDVYALFARRFGVVEIYAACLDLRTGAARWVSYVGAAESGRDPGGAEAVMGLGRGERAPVRAVPWGALPALADGELCVVPHAGLAAGLEAATGRLRWVRALARYPAAQLPLSLGQGHGPRNAPLAEPGSWTLAPQDSPALLSLARGTGELRWRWPDAAAEVGAAVPLRDLVGPAPPGAALAGVRLDGPFGPAVLVAGPPTELKSGEEWGEGDLLNPRTLDLGPWAARAVGGALWLRAWPGEVPPPRDRTALPDPPGGALRDGDLFHVEPLWLVLEPGRLSAFADEPEARRLLLEPTAEADEAPGQAAARQAVAARVLHAPERLVGALASAGADAGARRIVGEAVLDLLRRAVERREVPEPALLADLERLPDGLRAGAFELAARALRDAGRLDQAVALLGRWIDAPPGLLARPPLGVRDVLSTPAGAGDEPWDAAPREALRVRGDLVAADMLRRLQGLPAAAAALAGRERLARERLARALESGGAGEVAEALRTAGGTAAAAVGRRVLAERAVAHGRWGEAAAFAADLRLDPPPEEAVETARARRWAAAWQLREAGWLARAGDPAAARSLLLDLLRWVPSGTRDGEGRTSSELLAELTDDHGWAVVPGDTAVGPLRFPEDVAQPLDREGARAVVLPSVSGPGAWRVRGRVLVARGLALEVRDLASGQRVAEFETGDQGWFGGTLQDVAPWLPERGVRVSSVVAGEPADRAGVHAGDWIASWGGRPLRDTADLMARIAASAPGADVDVEVLRASQPVLRRFVAGRRPLAEGAGTIERERLWADGAGRVLVPVRNGLLRVDLAAASAERLWSWEGPGTVLRAEVTAGLVVVTVRRLHSEDLLVALDPASGRERWRADVDGAVAWVRATGSALHVQVDDPARAVVLDRADGRPRLVLPRAARPWERQPNTLERSETAASAAGRVWTVRGEAGVALLDVANTTTGAVAPVARERPRGPEDYLLPPALAADAYVALLLGPHLIRVYAPDPLSDGVLDSTSLEAGLLMSQHDHHGGALNLESRVVMTGITLYVVRLRPTGSAGRGGASVSVFAPLDAEAAGPLRFTFVDRAPPLLSSAGELYLTALEPHPDGLLVAANAAYPGADGSYARGVLWVPGAEAGEARDSSPAPWNTFVTHWRRSAPARVGGALLLPDDAGAAIVPLRRP